MNNLKGLAAYECFSSAHFPLELKVLCGDMLWLTLNWSDHSRSMDWLILLLCVLCEFPVSVARQQLVGSVSCLVFYLFIHICPLSFLSILVLISERERKVSLMKEVGTTILLREERKKKWSIVWHEWAFAEEYMIQWHQVLMVLLWSRMKFSVVTVQSNSSPDRNVGFFLRVFLRE